MGDGKARRYGVGVGKAGFEWTGSERITQKKNGRLGVRLLR